MAGVGGHAALRKVCVAGAWSAVEDWLCGGCCSEMLRTTYVAGAWSVVEECLCGGCSA